MKHPSWLKFLFFFFWLALLCSQSLMDVATSLLFLTGLWHLFKTTGEERVQIWSALKKSFLAKLFVVWIFVIAAGLFLVAPPEAHRWKNLLEFRWMIELGLWIFLLGKIQIVQDDLPWILGPPFLNAAYGLTTWIANFDPLDSDPRWLEVDRVGGLFSNPMPFAQSMGPVIAGLAAGTLIFWRYGEKISKLFLFCLLVIGLAVFFSYTRGIWVGLLVTGLILPPLLFPKRGWKLSVAVMIAAVGVALLPPVTDRLTEAFDPDRSYDGQRIVLWKTNLEIFKDSPLIGIGYSDNGRRLPEYFERLGFPQDQFKSHAHNQYLHFLAGTGILGLLCYLLFIGSFLCSSWKMVRRPSGKVWLDACGAALLAGQIVFHIGSLTESNFSIAKNRTLLLLLFALTFWVRRNRETSNPPLTPRPKN